jgi:phosphoglycerate dehydrogenase-like enzyme
MTPMDKVYVLFTLPLENSSVERIKDVSPRLQVNVHPTSSGEDIPEELLADVEVLYTLHALPEPESVPELRWIQFHSAGIDHVVDHPLLHTDVQVTTLSGAAAPQMAEFAVMSMLALGHKLLDIISDPPEERWGEKRYQRYEPLELRGCTVGVVGYGSIGREIARLCYAFGADVLASKRDLKNLQDTGYCLEGLGDPAADVPKRLYPPEALRSMAALCDFLVVTVPLTAATRGLIGTEIFDAMKPSTFLIDVSRGGVVDHGALLEALKTEKLAGAALDVYPVEPLPDSSPLWEMPNVILSPHIAGSSAVYDERAMDLFAENLFRYLSDRPLLNLYRPDLTY